VLIHIQAVILCKDSFLLVCNSFLQNIWLSFTSDGVNDMTPVTFVK